MPFSNARGEMYPFVTHTHNPIKGGCWNILHGYGCRYCFVGIKQLGRGQYNDALILHEDELKDQYKPGKVYFVGSAVDMFHPNVSDDDIGRILSNCDLWQRQCPASLEKPKYLFQTKNPERFQKFLGEIPLDSTLATTYETDDEKLYGAMSRAPKPNERLEAMQKVYEEAGDLYSFMLSVEPIMKHLSLGRFVDKVVQIPWDLVSIGADSCEAIAREKQPAIDYLTFLARDLERAGLKVLIKSNCLNLAENPRASDAVEHWDYNGWIYHREQEKKETATQGSFL